MYLYYLFGKLLLFYVFSIAETLQIRYRLQNLIITVRSIIKWLQNLSRGIVCSHTYSDRKVAKDAT